MSRLIGQQEEWGRVIKDLESEHLKLASYDSVILSLLGSVKNKKILDYGAGPGVLALALRKLGAVVKTWDINTEMRRAATAKIGAETVYERLDDIPKDYFDFVICNLLLCIVEEDEVKRIASSIKEFISLDGTIFIGFCNPKIFSVKETNLDFRLATGDPYEKNHKYKKIKKEGGYEIVESHRPIEWYERIYREAGLKVINKYFTPEYELKGEKIRDFIIFELRR